MLFRLPNGGPAVVIRAIRPEDKQSLGAAVRRLSDESQRNRFLAPKDRLSNAELSYLTEVDGEDHVAYVALEAADPGRIIGVGRWVRSREDPTAAEVAITVGDDFHGKGLGSRLGLLLADAARERGISRFTATMLADNTAAHRLFARVSSQLKFEHAGSVDEVVGQLAAA